MKFTRSRYPAYPGCPGDPCWALKAKYLWIDIDWNPRFPFGACAGFYFGPEHEDHLRSGGFTIDVNPPLGEPNRLYASAFGWRVTLALSPGHGISRYNYHQVDEDHWERNDKPEPGHWGWLTVTRT